MLLLRDRWRGVAVVKALGAIIALTIVGLIVYPLIARPRDTTQRPNCPSNLKKLSYALRMYISDHDDRLPPDQNEAGALPFLIQPYLKGAGLWKCPAETDAAYSYDGSPNDVCVSYGYNWLTLAPGGVGIRADTLRQPENTVGLVDATGLRVAPGDVLAIPLAFILGAGMPLYRHNSGANVMWMDGHIKWTKRPELEAQTRVENDVRLGTGIDGYRYWNRW